MDSVSSLLAAKKMPLIMGILNVTPDSFYSGSRRTDCKGACDAVLRMAEEGADIVDIGAESTRPWSGYIDRDEELGRLIPVLKEVRRRSSVPVSVDTRRADVAEAALGEGADIINDISACRDDLSMTEIVKKYKCDIIIVHMKGNPRDMQEHPFYLDAVSDIGDWLVKRAGYLMEKGVSKERIIIDPGIGFGKRCSDNIALLKHLDLFKKFGFPVLAGYSRKSFIGEITGRDTEERLPGSLAAGIVALLKGADILRVHDVKETVDTVKMADAFLNIC